MFSLLSRYAHVVPKCLEDSPTAQWWNEYYASGGKQADLVVHIEKQADFGTAGAGS